MNISIVAVGLLVPGEKTRPTRDLSRMALRRCLVRLAPGRFLLCGLGGPKGTPQRPHTEVIDIFDDYLYGVYAIIENY